MINLIDIYKTYQIGATSVDALKNINLKVNAGEIFGVIGPSGAGKSTLIRTINLLERPTQGQVIVCGVDLTQMTKAELRHERSKIGMIFQHFNLLSSRTTFENVALPLELAGISKSVIKEQVMSLLELTGLAHRKDSYPSQLSGGQKQRVAIARALASKPKVLLSDEATSSLDPETTHSILQLLKDINKKLGLTILLITHEMEVVKEICNRLAIMEHGQILEQADVVEFFSKPKTALAKKFIRADLTHKLPENILSRFTDEHNSHTNPLLRISFLGKAASEPFISHLIQQLAIELNILQANIEHIRDEAMGVMIVEISADADKLQQAINYLNSKNINVEIIGYVKRNVAD